MSYSITNLKQEIAGILHGTTLNQVTAFEQLVYRAARQLMLDIDPQEMIRKTQMTNPIYNSIYDYVVPEDIKGNRVIDLAPQVNRTNQDFYPQAYNRDFDIFKGVATNPSFTMMFNTGIKTIRINAPQLTSPTVINTADSINGNGAWAVGGDATDLEEDQQNFAAGNGSLSMTLGLSGSFGWIQNQTMNTVDLTDTFNEGKVFVYVYLPIATNFTSVELRWGSSSSDYYAQTVTTDMNGNTLTNGWNLLSFDYFNSIQTGTVDITKVKFARVGFSYNGTLMTGVKIDNIISSLGSILNIEYYSKYMFRDSVTGAWQETITDDSNIINLDTESYNLLVDLVAIHCAQQVQGVSATQFDFSFWQKQYDQGIARYKGLYKSQVQKPQSTYYKKPNSSYGQWANIRYNR